MAKEEDDDSTFGDFSFASFPSNQIPDLPSISTNPTPQEDDDEWGDFVKTPPKSTIHNHNPNPLHPHNDSPKSTGSNLKGPLPLSLFGDVEDHDDESIQEPQDKVSPASVPASVSKKRSGFNDIIADLYSYNDSNTSNVNLSRSKSDVNNEIRGGNGSRFDFYGKGLNLHSKGSLSSNVDENVGKGFENNEIRGGNGSRFDFYGKGLNLDSKDSGLEKKGDRNKEGKGENGFEFNGSKSDDNNGIRGENGSRFDFYGKGSNLDSVLGKNGYEYNGSLKSSRSNVEENVVKGFDFSGWGLESSENNSKTSMGKVEKDGVSYDLNRAVSSAKASTSSTSAFEFGFGGWGKGSNGGASDLGMLNNDGDVNGLMGSEGMSLNGKDTGLDGNGNGKGGDIDDDDGGWEFKGAFSESKGSKDLFLEKKGDGNSSSSKVDKNEVKGFDFSGCGLESTENNSSTGVVDQSKEGRVEKHGVSHDLNRLVSSANASTSSTSAFEFGFGGWGKDLGMLNNDGGVKGLMGSEGMRLNGKDSALDGNEKGGDIDDDEEEDDGWEFKGAFSGSKGSNGIGVALNSDYSSNDFSPNKGVSLTSKNEDLEGGGNNGNKEDENEGWDFQGTFPEEKAGHTIDKVGPSIHEPSNTSSYSTGFSNGSNNAVNLFAISDGLDNLFPTGSGVSTDSSNLVQKSSSLAAPINFTPDILFRSEASEVKAQLSSSDKIIEDAEADDDFGEFTTAFSETGPNRETDSNVKDLYASGTNAATSISLDQVNGGQQLDRNSQLDAYMPSSSIGSSRVIDLFSISNGSTDLFSMANPIDGTSLELQTYCDRVSSNAAEIRGDGPTHEGSTQESNRDGLSPHSVPESGEIEDDVSDFAVAFPEAGQEALEAGDPSESHLQESAASGKDLGTGPAAGNNKGALPLSLFWDAESEVDTSIQSSYTHSRSVSQSSGLSPQPPVSINDLISSLYSQAEQISPHKFVGATDSGAGPTIEVNSEPEHDDDDLDDDSWEFKDSFGFEGTSKETLSPKVRSIPSEVMVNNHVDYFFKLQDILNFLIKSHLENMKKDGHSAKVMAMDEEFQDELEEHVREAVLTKEDGFEGQPTTDASFHEFIEALKDPKFQVLEAEYDLSRKLSLAEKDLKSALELKRHIKTIISLLSLGSLEDHLLYVNLWSKMISSCAQELRAGGKIWKQSLGRNVKNELLSETEGKEFVKALGEIYRVAMVLGVSARLYKPWTLECSAESTQMCALLDECRNVWSTSGLREALSEILQLESANDNNDLPSLVESIQYIHNLDKSALKDFFNWKESRCGLSLLTLDVIPGMKMVVWDGKTYLVKLANLWANMISSDPPRVPPLHGG